MLKKIKLKNFRSHENTVLEFHKGVNVIYGLGQSGKTNILRAINWVVNNRPSGFNMHSHFSDDDSTSVELTLDNGIVEVEKTSKLTTYSLNREAKFSYIGKSVPEPITNLLNINEINISNQLDAPFLITDSPGEVGKIINRITKIEQVDSWIARLTTRSNISKHEADSLEIHILNLKQDLTHYDGLQKLESLINMHSKIEKHLVSKQSKIEDISYKKEKLKDLQEHTKKLDTKTLNSLFKETEQIDQTISEKNDQLYPLKVSLVSFKNLTTKTENLSKILLSMDKDFKELNSLNSTIDITRKKVEILCLYSATQDQAILLTKKMKQSRKEYQSLMLELHFCPLCGSKITDKIKEI